jgi:Fic family protein
MDPERFSPEKPGELRKYYSLEAGRDGWLFIPNEMPPAWEFPTHLWPLLSEATTSLGTLNGIGQTLPNPELLLRPLQSREAITSSKIEGTYVTPRQLLLYELDPTEPTDIDDDASSWREVFNYSLALRSGCQMLAELPIGTRLIQSMHKVLMTGVRGQDKSPGRYREIQVQIGATGKYVPPPHHEISRLMGNLEKFMNESAGRYDPLVASYIAHYQFEAIHPFVDGNGRVGRALLALMIFHKLGHSMPWLYMSAYFEKYKEEYTENLFRISTRGDWGHWIEFCLHGTVLQARDAIARCNRFNQARKKFHDLCGTRSPRSHDIVEGLFESPVLTIPYLKKKFGVHYQTAQKDVEKLMELGILREIPGKFPRSLYSPELMRIAYSDTIEEIDTESSNWDT